MKEIMTTEEAAEYLGYSPDTLKSARSTGILSGVAPPPYIKAGRAVRYRKATLDSWLLQFGERTQTELKPA